MNPLFAFSAAFETMVSDFNDTYNKFNRHAYLSHSYLDTLGSNCECELIAINVIVVMNIHGNIHDVCYIRATEDIISYRAYDVESISEANNVKLDWVDPNVMDDLRNLIFTQNLTHDI